MKLAFWMLIAAGVMTHAVWLLEPALDTSTALHIAYGFYAAAGGIMVEAVWRFLEGNTRA
jgi:chromate transport protein ChrA